MSENRFSPDAQRYLDGGPPGELGAAERGAADRLRAAAQAYRDSVPRLDASLDRRVMAALGSRAGPRRRGALAGWLLEPRVGRLWVPLAAAAAALLVWVAAPRGAREPAPPAAVAAADTVFVHFSLSAPSARSVALAGSFNGWDASSIALSRTPEGAWAVTVPLPVGEHQYQFVVDGTRWQPDPSAHALIDDGFGGRNSVIVVGPKGLVRT